MIRPPHTPLRERGSSMAEFAIAVTASLVMIVGIVELGRAMYAYHLISNAARLATRYAAVRGTSCAVAGCPASTTSVRTYVRGLAPELNQSQITVDTTWSTSPACAGAPYQGPGCYVQVAVSYPFTFVAVPLLPNLSMPMSSTSKMIISQ